MARRLFFIVGVISFFIFSCDGEKEVAPSTTDKFIKLYPSSLVDVGVMIQEVSDGYIVLANSSGGDRFVRLLHLDEYGNRTWSKLYNSGGENGGEGSEDLVAKSMEVINDGEGYIIVADRIHSNDSTSAFLFKVDNSGGNFISQGMFSSELVTTLADGEYKAVDVEINNNELVTLFQFEGVNTQNNHYILSKRNISDLTLLDGCTPLIKDQSNYELLNAVFINETTGKTTYGAMVPRGNRVISNIIAATNFTDCSYANIVSGLNDDEFTAFSGDLMGQQMIPSGENFCIVGTNIDGGEENIYISVVNENGSNITTKIYNEDLTNSAEHVQYQGVNDSENIDLSGNQSGYSITRTSDNGFVIVGSNQNEDNIGNGIDVLMLKTDGFGNVKWFRSFGGADDEYGRYVIATSDGGYAILSNIQYGNVDMISLIKTDKNGHLN